jgi:urease accessory protein UreF
MHRYANKANWEAEELLGEWHPLVEQLGSTEGLVSLASASSALQSSAVTNRSSLLSFLEAYKSRILVPFELPAILRAFLHASRNETRELISFDQQMAREPLLRELTRASRRVGQYQLGRLSPLRDHRLLQRYLRAVRQGRAHGWHTLVFGLTLSIYSLPVRQGLVFYERQTLRGFLYTGAAALRLSHRDCARMLDQICSDLPHHLDILDTLREWGPTTALDSPR